MKTPLWMPRVSSVQLCENHEASTGVRLSVIAYGLKSWSASCGESNGTHNGSMDWDLLSD